MFSFNKSELRKKLFIYYFTNPESVHYVRELARILNVDPTNLSRELFNLERQGIFVSQEKGKQKYFQLNKKSNTFKELKSIVLKTIGVIGSLKDYFSKVTDINLAILYGSFASGKEDEVSDIDILVVGDINLEQISSAINDLEKLLQREISITIYSLKEFSKKKNTDPFLKSVLKNKYIILSGKL